MGCKRELEKVQTHRCYLETICIRNNRLVIGTKTCSIGAEVKQRALLGCQKTPLHWNISIFVG